MVRGFSVWSLGGGFGGVSPFPRVLGARLGGDCLILAIEGGDEPQRQGLRGKREYIESPKGRHAMCESPNAGNRPVNQRTRQCPLLVAKERVISKVHSLSRLLWLC